MNENNVVFEVVRVTYDPPNFSLAGPCDTEIVASFKKEEDACLFAHRYVHNLYWQYQKEGDCFTMSELRNSYGIWYEDAVACAVTVVKRELEKQTHEHCPHCGVLLPEAPENVLLTHCTCCGYQLITQEQRIRQLYGNMLNHISELVSGSDLVDTLHAIGFTDDEIAEEVFLETKELPEYELVEELSL